MSHFYLLVVCICGLALKSSFAHRNYYTPFYQHGHHVPHHHVPQHHVPQQPIPQRPIPVDEEYSVNHGCSCLLMVDDEQVFRRDDSTGWYSCTGLGLYRCTQYCTELFQDENIRYRSRQGACDIIGQEIYTPWYRRNQVCGVNGPYEDIALQTDLCCRRGRPSENCENTSQN